MLRYLAESKGIKVLRSYNQYLYDHLSRDFFDAYHGHDYVVKEILKGIGKLPIISSNVLRADFICINSERVKSLYRKLGSVRIMMGFSWIMKYKG